VTGNKSIANVEKDGQIFPKDKKSPPISAEHPTLWPAAQRAKAKTKK
jgi:hypothetical protein